MGKTGWIIGSIIVLAIIYFLFSEKINTYLGFGKNKFCKKTFFVKLPDGKTQNINTADIGTTENPLWKYYKKDVTITQDGLANIGENIEITEEEFGGFCQYIYHPPYPWYTEKPTQEVSGH